MVFQHDKHICVDIFKSIVNILQHQIIEYQ